MSYDYNKARAAWRKIATTAHSVTVARVIAKRSLIQMDTAIPRLAFDAALEAAPPLRDIDWDGGHTWGTLKLLGVEREEVPHILEAMGASEEEIAEAVKCPEAAYAALSKWAKAYRDPKPTQLPNIGRF
jgi:hypothetical protein